MQRHYYDVYDKNDKPLLLNATSAEVSEFTGLPKGDAHRHVGRLIYGEYMIAESVYVEHETQEAADTAFVRKFGVKAFREWVTMNVRYGGKKHDGKNLRHM